MESESRAQNWDKRGKGGGRHRLFKKGPHARDPIRKTEKGGGLELKEGGGKREKGEPCVVLPFKGIIPQFPQVEGSSEPSARKNQHQKGEKIRVTFHKEKGTPLK